MEAASGFLEHHDRDSRIGLQHFVELPGGQSETARWLRGDDARHARLVIQHGQLTKVIARAKMNDLFSMPLDGGAATGNQVETRAHLAFARDVLASIKGYFANLLR